MEEWHIIALLGITIIVYARVFLKETPKIPHSENPSKQMEETLELFTAEIEEENKQVLNHIVRMKRQFDNDTNELKARLEMLERKLEAQTIDDTFVKHESAVSLDEPPGSNEENAAALESESIKMRYKELFALHHDGKSVDAISRKTGLAKGEVQLILKLAKQEEAARD